MIKVIITDAYEIVLEGLYRLIEPIEGIEIVGKAKNGKEVLNILHETATDIVILDIEMPEMNGFETTAEILKKFPHVKVLVYSMYNNIRYIEKFIEAGVKGYILKNKPKEEVIIAIKAIYDNEKYFGEGVKEILLERVINPDKLYDKIQLTEREIEVLKLIAKGDTTRQIAEKLFISHYTVTSHRRKIMEKTGLCNAAQLTVFAIRASYIPITDL